MYPLAFQAAAWLPESQGKNHGLYSYHLLGYPGAVRLAKGKTHHLVHVTSWLS